MTDVKSHSGAIDLDTEAPLKELWHDNGDGTYSRTLWIGATITATIGSLQIPDGQNVVEGATNDAAVQGDVDGSMNARLRGIATLLGTPSDTSASASLYGALQALHDDLDTLAQDVIAQTALAPALTTRKTIVATASGDTALWTPVSGKTFTLYRVRIEVTQNASQASGGVLTIALRDATTPLGLTCSLFVPASAATGFGPGYSTGWIDLPGGIVSASADNPLNLNLSAALVTGTVRAIALGTED